MNEPESTDPEQAARQCRRRIDAEYQPEIDLAELANELGIAVRRAPLRNILGAALLVDGEAAVVVDENQAALRGRFTQAHEFGHLTIPRHRRLLRRKSGVVDQEIRTTNPSDRVEKEANRFAAELLAPRKLVEAFLESRDAELRTAMELQRKFRVSLTSAALRMADLIDTPCAVVQFRNDRIEWFRRPSDFPYGLPDHGAPPPERSVTAHVADGGDAFRESVEVSPADWLVERDRDYPSRMYESSMLLGETGLQLTVLSIRTT